jgi:hypothetical protein
MLSGLVKPNNNGFYRASGRPDARTRSKWPIIKKIWTLSLGWTASAPCATRPCASRWTCFLLCAPTPHPGPASCLALHVVHVLCLAPYAALPCARVNESLLGDNKQMSTYCNRMFHAFHMYVAYVSFGCCKSRSGVAYVVMTIHVCCKYMFQIF